MLKRNEDHLCIQTKNCGEIIEVLTGRDYSSLGIALAINIHKTEAHYHTNFDEIYFLLDGELTLQIYDPRTLDTRTIELKANELFLVEKGVHHKVLGGSENNRLCVITSPPFDAQDEWKSKEI